jgi:uncharacterized membrane protein
MKKLLLFAFVLAAASVNYGYAQEKAAPRTDFSVSLSENVITIKPGETKSLTVTILKSKSFSRSDVKLGLSSSLPEGLTVAYEPAEGKFESSVATFTASADAKAGEFQVVLKTTMNNKTKGSIVKVVIDSSVAKDAVSVND